MIPTIRILMFTLLFTTLSNIVSAQIIKTEKTIISFNNKGFYNSIKVDNKEILGNGEYPIISAIVNNNLILPIALKVKGNLFAITLSNNDVVELLVEQHKQAITYEVKKISPAIDLLIFGPLKINLNEVVGEVLGLAQHKDIAFGMHALHIKTTAGIPKEYIESYSKRFQYNGTNTELSVASIPFHNFAAVKTDDGTIFQLTTQNRTKTKRLEVNNVPNSLVLPVKGENGLITGAKVALFGDRRENILTRIGQVELEQGLPHPIIEDEWSKTSRSSMRSYLITDFTKDNFDFYLEKTKKAGFKNLYHTDPFATWGHFTWKNTLSTNGDAGIKDLVQKAQQHSIDLGIHTLTNFTTVNDKYVTPIPTKNLLKQDQIYLVQDIDTQQSDITIKYTSTFETPLTLNALQIGDELITYGTFEKNNDQLILKNCKRGAFGTTASAHSKSEVFYKLWDYPYKTLFPDLELQDDFAKRLAEIFNNTGIKQISFDGLEGSMYTGHGYYATAKFVTDFYNQVKDKNNLLNDASRLDHYLWHIHTRMNWGEPWGEEMRKGQVANRIKNQDYFKRNLLPRMLGWFLVRLDERQFEATSLEDLEWALSEAAGFDAGYAMSINTRTLSQHGLIDTLLVSMKNWDELRLTNSFSEQQKNKLKDPETEWHLQKMNNENYLLFPLFVSERYKCNLNEMQPGQPGGADWFWKNPEKSTVSLRIKIVGDGAILNPSFKTDLGTIKIIGQLEENQYILLDHDNKASLVDRNYKKIKDLEIQGSISLPQGGSTVAFSCDTEDSSAPEVIVRYITRGNPEKITKKKKN